MSPKWYLAIPLLPKLALLVIAAFAGIAYAADPTAAASIDVMGELWTMAKAAGILGTVVLGFLLQREIKRGDRDRIENTKLHEERDAMHERSLTALLNLTNTMQIQSQVAEKLNQSVNSLVSWLKYREGAPPTE